MFLLGFDTDSVMVHLDWLDAIDCVVELMQWLILLTPLIKKPLFLLEDEASWRVLRIEEPRLTTLDETLKTY